ncbi:hypothetical protein IMZ48_00345 [Candidatus Bathyarchaeota archaeon]|nr:hypothetical protein [Candidatus Bathyarchaeota archaeon]
MAGRPELARLVEELIWYEFRPEFINPDLARDETETCEEVESCDVYATPVLSADFASWCEVESDPGEYIDQDLRTFRVEFFKAVVKMPRLTGFTTMPMPSEHVLSRTPCLLTARDFYQGLLADRGPKQKRTGFRLCPAPGFEGFLRPAMVQFGPKIERLQLVDPP